MKDDTPFPVKTETDNPPIPEGYYRVTTGLTQKGDRYWKHRFVWGEVVPEVDVTTWHTCGGDGPLYIVIRQQPH